MVSNEPAVSLAEAKGRAYLEAPAGFGKTETIATALLSTTGRQLVLTHTHAGVDSLKKRLRLKSVPSGRYRIETIDALCMRYARGYPKLSKFDEASLDSNEVWEESKRCALRVFQVSQVQALLADIYSGVIVDEYQDCSKLQHEIITTLSKNLPLRILGDPLQSLFTWSGQDPISWQDDILHGGFQALPPLTTPQRWRHDGADPELGEWIATARSRLLTGQHPEFASPVKLVEAEDENDLRQKIYSTAAEVAGRAGSDRVLIITGRAFKTRRTIEGAHLRTANPLAIQLSGLRFTVMMEIEAKLLRSWCEELEPMDGLRLALGLVEFADECCQRKTQQLDPIVRGLRSADLSAVRPRRARALHAWLQERERTFSIGDAEEWLRLLGAFESRNIHHRELFFSMCQALRRRALRKDHGLADAARSVREQQSHAGRRTEYRVISRTLLVKGLQFEHVIVLHPEAMDACNQYVAFSRATKSLTVITTKPGHVRGLSQSKMNRAAQTNQLTLF